MEPKAKKAEAAPAAAPTSPEQAPSSPPPGIREIKRADGTVVRFPGKRRAAKKAADPEQPPARSPTAPAPAPAAPPPKKGGGVGWVVAGVVIGIGVIGCGIWLLSEFTE